MQLIESKYIDAHTFVPFEGGTSRDVGKEQREFSLNRWLIIERKYG